ncbi:unnamed protein product [Symbiodinium microadriaticum]|nr:unnamed protein product [Symbiodinium microadriaticum]
MGSATDGGLELGAPVAAFTGCDGFRDADSQAAWRNGSFCFQQPQGTTARVAGQFVAGLSSRWAWASDFLACQLQRKSRRSRDGELVAGLGRQVTRKESALARWTCFKGGSSTPGAGGEKARQCPLRLPSSVLRTSFAHLQALPRQA